MRIHVIHENDAWVEPLRAAFDELGLPYQEWFLSEGLLDLSEAPPEGVFYNRMSASSHTRDHRYAVEYTGAVLAWLESHRRRVINTSRALQLEVSKVAQYSALANYGIRTPRTIAAVGRANIIAAAERMTGPFITKHNRAGKGLGVHLFRELDALVEHLDGPGFENSVDGVTLIQEYIQSPEPFITRVEFVGGKFLYAVRVDTSLGFELCPADVCQIGDAFCPVGEGSENEAVASGNDAVGRDADDNGRTAARVAPRFSIIDGFESPLIKRYSRFLADNGIDIAGIEFITDARGEVYTYDVNTNTNYNSDAESVAGIHAMREIAAYLGRELREQQAQHHAALEPA